MKSAAYKYKDEQERLELVEFVTSIGYIRFRSNNNIIEEYIIINSNFRKDQWCLAKSWNIVKDSNRVLCSTKEEFMKLANELAPNPKPIEPDLPQTFAIVGKPHQLASIYQDLIDLGYLEDKHKGLFEHISHIGLQTVKLKNDKQAEFFKSLYCVPSRYTFTSPMQYEKVFNLPEDYSKALEFAQKMLNHNFWDKNATRKKELGEEIKELIIDKNKLEEELTDICLRIDKLQSEKDSL